jgi:hypothetical protein
VTSSAQGVVAGRRDQSAVRPRTWSAYAVLVRASRSVSGPWKRSLPVVDDADDVADLLHVGEDVGRQQHGLGVGEPADEVEDLAAAGRVERRGRLVEEEHLGVADEAGGEPEPLEHPAGEPADPAVERVAEPDLVSTSSTRARGQLGRRQVPGEVDDLAGGQPRLELRGVDEHADRVAGHRQVDLPAVGSGADPARIDSIVVLPAPLGPISP